MLHEKGNQTKECLSFVGIEANDAKSIPKQIENFYDKKPKLDKSVRLVFDKSPLRLGQQGVCMR